MMLQIPGVLGKGEVARLRALIDDADWTDGNVTSGFQSALAKQNRQLPEGSDAAREAGAAILAALERHPLFLSAALPARIGDGNGYAELCIVIACEYLDLRFPDIDWRGDHPNLARLYEKLSARQSFIDTRPS